jgi:hypothetical protein
MAAVRAPRATSYLALACGLGCGPSFHAIYEGNARFEHCYALEEDSKTGMNERADCWRDWSEHYTYGQTRDRIQYAISRYVALAQAPNIPTDEALMMAAPGMTPRLTTITAPAPTSATEPPPKVLDPQDASPPQMRPSEQNVLVVADAGPAPVPPAASAAPASLPGASCTDACEQTFQGCDGGATCARSYRTCMRGCFK